MTYVGAVTEADQTTILVVDDHPLFREALFQVVKEAFTGYRVVDLPDWDSTVNWLREDDSVELVLMDLNMPGVTGFSGLTTLRQDQPALPVVIISSTEDRAVASQALSLGAAGFLPKSLPRAALTEALNRIMDGEVVAPEGLYGDGAEDGSARSAPAGSAAAASHGSQAGRPTGLPPGLDKGDQQILTGIAELTGQQRRVLEMLVEGKSNKIIAYELDIAESTVKAHVSAILRKLQVHSRTQAVIKAGPLLPYV